MTTFNVLVIMIVLASLSGVCAMSLPPKVASIVAGLLMFGSVVTMFVGIHHGVIKGGAASGLVVAATFALGATVTAVAKWRSNNKP